jgi:DNA-binding HxlR family transcriptional regulator
MADEKRKVFLNMLRKMSKKGFYETMEFIAEKQPVHYTEILRFDIDNEVVKTRSSVTIILRTLLKMGLVERQVIDSQPVRTLYKPTCKGLEVQKCLKEMESL